MPRPAIPGQTGGLGEMKDQLHGILGAAKDGVQEVLTAEAVRRLLPSLTGDSSNSSSVIDSSIGSLLSGLGDSMKGMGELQTTVMSSLAATMAQMIQGKGGGSDQTMLLMMLMMMQNSQRPQVSESSEEVRFWREQMIELLKERQASKESGLGMLEQPVNAFLQTAAQRALADPPSPLEQLGYAAKQLQELKGLVGQDSGEYSEGHLKHLALQAEMERIRNNAAVEMHKSDTNRMAWQTVREQGPAMARELIGGFFGMPKSAPSTGAAISAMQQARAETGQ